MSSSYWASLVVVLVAAQAACSAADPHGSQPGGRRAATRAAAGLVVGGGGGGGSDGALRQLSQSAEAGGKRCPPLSKEILDKRARNNTVMLAVMNEAQWDFGMNWRHHVGAAGVDYYVVAATDVPTSRRLAAMGEPCFERIDEETQKLGLKWGEEGWRRMTWSKVFLVDAVIDWGFHLVVSDLDVVWFKDPMPLFQAHAAADLIFSHDGTSSHNEVGDGGLEATASDHYSYNTGVYLIRNSAVIREWAHAYKAFYDKCKGHDQVCSYEMTRSNGAIKTHPSDPRIVGTWGDKIWMGVLPASVAQSAHSSFLQQLHQVKKVDRYVVHMTWTYNGIPGKRSRLRDMMLWVDPPEYYSDVSLVTVDLQLPEPRKNLNKWNENEDIISFHLDSIHAQLQQAYVGMALATAAGRAFMLPKFACYCEKIWYSVVRCRTAEAQDMPLPVRCPQDYLFQPGHYDDDGHGTPLTMREPSFLDNERTPAAVKDSVLVIQPSAALKCSDCVQEVAEKPPGVSMVLLVPPALTDAQLLPLLAPYEKFKVWRLSFEGVGDVARAYAGFQDSTEAQQFNTRMEHIPTNFCCRRAEESPRYHKESQDSVQLNMTSKFRFEGSTSGTSRAL